MARHETTVKIPTNLLSNFNPYDILEPEKCSTVPAVEKLIDIGDFPLSKDVNASLMDQKSDYNLVDLYENMYVTAQHVKLKNNDIIGFDINDSDSNGTSISSGYDSHGTNISSGSDSSDIANSYDDIAFKQFCDKIESGERIDWTRDINEIVVNKPRVVDSKVVTEDELDPEDVIYEVLSQKTTEKRILDELNKGAATSNANIVNEATINLEFPKPKVLNGPNIDFKTQAIKIGRSDTCKEFPTLSKIKKENDMAELSRLKLKVLNVPNIDLKTPEKNIERCHSSCNCKEIPQSSKFKSEIDKDIPQSLKFKSEAHKDIPQNSKFKSDIDLLAEISRLKLNNCLLNENIYKNTQYTFNIKVDGQIDNKPDFQLIAMKKNEKAYKKKMIKKPERLTCNYTDGADFDEKQIVLPQIMARINARKKYLKEKSLLKRRLILDSGKKSLNTNEINKSGNNIGNCSSALNFYAPESGSSLPKDDKYCCNCSIKSHGNDVSDDVIGKVNPIVVMEDCNKERLMAWRRSQMFKEFVNGK